MAPIATDPTIVNLLLKALLFSFDGAGASDGGPPIHDGGRSDGGIDDGEGLCSGGEAGGALGAWCGDAGGTGVGDGAGAGDDDGGVLGFV